MLGSLERKPQADVPPLERFEVVRHDFRTVRIDLTESATRDNISADARVVQIRVLGARFAKPREDHRTGSLEHVRRSQEIDDAQRTNPVVLYGPRRYQAAKCAAIEQ